MRIPNGANNSFEVSKIYRIRDEIKWDSQSPTLLDSVRILPNPVPPSDPYLPSFFLSFLIIILKDFVFQKLKIKNTFCLPNRTISFYSKINKIKLILAKKKNSKLFYYSVSFTQFYGFLFVKIILFFS